MFTMEQIRERVGGPEAFQRVLGLQAQIVKRSDKAIAARVTSPFASASFDVMVSRELAGRCACGEGKPGLLCDHVAAAALEWILDGDLPVAAERAQHPRFP
jgi:hypothetical protein